MSKLLKQAFTLIELLVVIAIIGILSGLIVVSMGGMTDKASIAKTQIFSNSLKNSLMMNIVGEWKMDEGSGTAANDTWAKVNNGALTNFTNTTAGYGDSISNADGWMSSSNCVSGTCLKFDGVDDYVNCGNANLVTGKFTISAWVKFNKANLPAIGYGGVVTQWWDGSKRNFDLLVYKTTGYAYIEASNPTGSSANTLMGTVDIGDSKWHNITATYDRSSIKLYTDGSYNSMVAKSDDISTNTANLMIGNLAHTTATAYLNGAIDDVRIYNESMPTSEIKEQYYFGLNSLLANKSITSEEYWSRIDSLAKF